MTILGCMKKGCEGQPHQVIAYYYKDGLIVRTRSDIAECPICGMICWDDTPTSEYDRREIHQIVGLHPVTNITVEPRGFKYGA